MTGVAGAARPSRSDDRPRSRGRAEQWDAARVSGGALALWLRAWCARPALAGALAGLTGGVAFVLLAAALTATPLHGGSAAAILAGLACSLVYGAVTGASLWGCHALAARALPATRRLEVYVAAHCFSCAEARRLAAAAARRFPGLEVHTIDLDAAGTGAPPLLPDGVVAVPTYLLDGAVVALGNPEPEQLFARIASASARNAGGGRGAA